MDIHKPKPWHGWREFGKELGTIVAGVLIALAGEQAVEKLDWDHKVAEARGSLSGELGEDLGQAQHRADISPCVERRLDDLAAIIDQAAVTGKLPATPIPGLPPIYTWDQGVWRSTLSAQVANHMPRDDLQGYTPIYEFIAKIDAYSDEELSVWTLLYGLAGPGRRFDPAEAAAFRQAIGQARSLDLRIGGAGLRVRQVIDAWNLPYDRRIFDSYADVKPADVAICQPMGGAPPAHYGAAPFMGSLERIRANPITRSDVGAIAPKGRY
jgi:hypothetical protein